MDITNHSFRRAMHCTAHYRELYSSDNSARAEPCRWTVLQRVYGLQDVLVKNYRVHQTSSSDESRSQALGSNCRGMLIPGGFRHQNSHIHMGRCYKTGGVSTRWRPVLADVDV